jgi:hypothetical protein
MPKIIPLDEEPRTAEDAIQEHKDEMDNTIMMAFAIFALVICIGFTVKLLVFDP